MNKFLNSFVKKYGSVIAMCSFAFAIFGANMPCTWPFYEPKEPKDIARLKKYTD